MNDSEMGALRDEDPFVQQLLDDLAAAGKTDLQNEVREDIRLNGYPWGTVGPMLNDFLNHLHTEGFEVGLRQYLRAYRLLAALRCAPSELKVHLCPAFARTPKQQELFHTSWERFFPAFSEKSKARVHVPRRGRRHHAIGPKPPGSKPFTRSEFKYIGGGTLHPDAPVSGFDWKRWWPGWKWALAVVAVALLAWWRLAPGPRGGPLIVVEPDHSRLFDETRGGVWFLGERDTLFLEDPTGVFTTDLAVVWESRDTTVVRVVGDVSAEAVELAMVGPGFTWVVAQPPVGDVPWDSVRVLVDPVVESVALSAPVENLSRNDPTAISANFTGAGGSAIEVLSGTVADSLREIADWEVISPTSRRNVRQPLTTTTLDFDTDELGPHEVVVSINGVSDTVRIQVSEPQPVTGLQFVDPTGNPLADTVVVGVPLDVVVDYMTRAGPASARRSAALDDDTVVWTLVDTSVVAPPVADTATRAFQFVALSPGSAKVRASVRSVNASFDLVVEAAPVAGGLRAARVLSLSVGEVSAIPTSLMSAMGGEMPAPDIQLRIADASVINSTGSQVQALKPGTTTVVSVSDSVFADTTEVYVSADPGEDPSRAWWYWPLLLGPAALTLLGGLVAIALTSVLVLKRESRRTAPTFWPLRLHEPVHPYPGTDELHYATRAMRQRQLVASRRLDLPATVKATIETAGYPDFRFATETRPPEYLVLIDSESPFDHQSRLFHALAAELREQGVYLTEYFFDGDPRVCMSVADNSWVLLVELRRRYPAHRVVLFTDGSRLLHPSTGELLPWVKEFASWRERAILTPAAPSTWGFREVMLSEHFSVLPSTLAGLAAAAEHFETGTRPNLAKWKGESEAPAVPRVKSLHDLPALQDYLGPELFRWVAALAMYPKLHWDLTLYLGSLTKVGPGLVTEDSLLRIIRLPWFRTGGIPSEFAQALRANLDTEQRRSINRAIERVLNESPPPQGSIAADRFRLMIAVQRVALEPEDPGRVAELREAIKEGSGNFVQEDFVMLSEVARSAETDGAMKLGESVEDWVRRYAVRERRPVPRLLKIAVAGLVLLNVGAFVGYESSLDNHVEQMWSAYERADVELVAQHEWTVAAVAVSEDGRTVAYATSDSASSADSTVVLSRDTREPRAVLGADHISLTSDGSVLAIWGDSATVWSHPQDQRTNVVDGVERVTAADLSQDGRRLVYAVPDTLSGGVVRLMSAPADAPEGWEEEQTWSSPSALTALEFSPSGGYLAAAGVGQLWIRDLTRQSVDTIDLSSNDTVQFTTWHSDGSMVASVIGDRVFITTADGSSTESWTEPDFVATMAFGGDPSLMAVVLRNGDIRVWKMSGQVRDGDEPLVLTPTTGGDFRAVALMPDGRSLLTGSTDGSVRIWRLP